jgi:hypothetical protein
MFRVILLFIWLVVIINFIIDIIVIYSNNNFIFLYFVLVIICISFPWDCIFLEVHYYLPLRFPFFNWSLQGLFIFVWVRIQFFREGIRSILVWIGVGLFITSIRIFGFFCLRKVVLFVEGKGVRNQGIALIYVCWCRVSFIIVAVILVIFIGRFLRFMNDGSIVFIQFKHIVFLVHYFCFIFIIKLDVVFNLTIFNFFI